MRSFTAAEIHDAIELRGTLEGLAARLAAERGVDSSLMALLHDCVARIDEVLEDADLSEQKSSQYIELNERFHRLLASACGSSVVEEQLSKAMALPFASPSGFVKVQAVAPDAHNVLIVAQAQHRAVLEAIERREGARAEALVREHAPIAHRNLQNALKNQQALTQLFGGNLIRQWARQVLRKSAQETAVLLSLYCRFSPVHSSVTDYIPQPLRSFLNLVSRDRL